MLVIACPHALGLAIPLVISLSSAIAARNGILVKDRLALERMRVADTVLFDKTGTLTEGQHAVVGVAAIDGRTESELNQQVTTIVQTLVILALGFATGARFPGGVGIMLVFVVSVILLAAAFASYSNALALLLRSQESVIGAVNFVVLPLSFLSSMLVPTGSLPGWIAAIARWNPVDWAVVIGRQTLSADVDWSVVGPRLGGLVALALVAGALAARSFASYQRSV